MALATQIVEVPFDRGLDTHANHKVTQELVALENAIFSERGALNTRYGAAALGASIYPSGTLGSTAVQLASHKDELLQVNADTLYAYSSAMSKWVARSRAQDLPALEVTRQAILPTSRDMRNLDACHSGSITMAAWVYRISGTNYVHVLVYDHVTGTVLLKDTAVSGSARVTPRCVALGSTLYVLYVGGNNLYERHVTTAAPDTLVAEATVATNVASDTASFDVNSLSSTVAVLAYNSSTAATSRVALFSAGAITSSTTFASASDRIAVLYHASLADIFVLYNNGASSTRILQLNDDLTVASAATVIEAVGGTTLALCVGYGSTASQVHVFYWDEVTDGVRTRVGASGTYTPEANLAMHCRVAAKPIVQGSERIALLVHCFRGASPAYFLVDGVSGNILAPALVGHAPTVNYNDPPANALARSSTEFLLPVLENNRTVVSTGYAYGLTGASSLTVTFDGTTARSRAVLGDTLFLAQGALLEYDGVGTFESGFPMTPQISSLAGGAGGTGSMSDGTYQMVAVYAWTDAKGQRHRSAPSLPVSVTLSAGGTTQSILATIFCCPITRRRDEDFGARQDIEIELYSTEANGSPDVLYRTGNSTADPYTTNNVYNDPSASMVQFRRTEADATLTDNERLYTDGGVLENAVVPATNFVFAHKDRLWAIPSEYPEEIWPSKKRLQREAVAFAAELVIPVNPDGGGLVGGASLDDKAVLFKRDAIYFVAGDGPDDTGGNNSWSEPIRIASDVGCTNPASIVETPQGVMFESAKGIYLLSRSLEVLPIGKPVKAYDGNTIVAANLVDDQNHVRFATSNGNTLTFDYTEGKWAIGTGQAAVDAVVHGTVYSYLLSTGVVRQESSALYQEAGTDYYLRAKTDWIKLGGLMGFQRVRRIAVLGDYKSAHTIRLRIYYDYDTTNYTEYSEPTSAFISGANVYQFQIHLATQKCQAIQVEIQASSAGALQAMSLTGLALEIGVKPGMARLPAAKVIA